MRIFIEFGSLSILYTLFVLDFCVLRHTSKKFTKVLGTSSHRDVGFSSVITWLLGIVKECSTGIDYNYECLESLPNTQLVLTCTITLIW